MPPKPTKRDIASFGGTRSVSMPKTGCNWSDGTAQELCPGDVVNIPAGVKHWHGAAPDSWFSHLAVEVPGEEASNEWLEPVDDEQYLKATDKEV